MEHLLNLAPVSSNQDLRRLRKLYDSVEVHVRGLKALGIASLSVVASSVLMNKISQDMRLIVIREVKGETGN